MSLISFCSRFLSENAKVCFVNADNGDITFEGMLNDTKFSDFKGREFFKIEGLGQEDDLIIYWRKK